MEMLDNIDLLKEELRSIITENKISLGIFDEEYYQKQSVEKIQFLQALKQQQLNDMRYWINEFPQDQDLAAYLNKKVIDTEIKLHREVDTFERTTYKVIKKGEKLQK